MVADDAARKRCGAAPLRTALEKLADGGGRRLQRLGPADRPSVVLSVGLVAVAIAILVLPTVILVLPWLNRAVEAWPL
jgi:hypothetical protein